MTNKPADRRSKPGPYATEPAAALAAPPLAEDILRGAAEIARFLYGDAKHRHRVYGLIRYSQAPLPAFRLGGLLCARRSAVRAWIAQKEAQGCAGGERSNTSGNVRRGRRRAGVRTTAPEA